MFLKNLLIYQPSKLFKINTLSIIQKRKLNILEHHSYKLLSDAGIPTPKYGVANNIEKAVEIAKNLQGKNYIVKAQVLAGGRGVGTFKNGFYGGVKIANSLDEVRDFSEKMLGQILVTKQTGSIGKPCNEIMIAERTFVRREFYVSIMMERSFDGPVLIASAEGGVNIEDVAVTNPKAIFYEPIDIVKGLECDQVCSVITKIGLETVSEIIAPIIMNMYELFVKTDAVLVEINPLAEDVCGDYFALDAKLRFDDDAAFRQTDLFKLRDFKQDDEKEIRATKYGLQYISLDGKIGCLVNGAGLAMATMDIIKLHGGEPANFLDVGGSATVEGITEAFNIIISDKHVKAIFVNIFGGIMKCDIIAQGIIDATEKLQMKVPVIVRLLGTNSKQGKELINCAKLKVISIDDFSESAKAAVTVAQIVHLSESLGLDVNFEMKQQKPK